MLGIPSLRLVASNEKGPAGRLGCDGPVPWESYGKGRRWSGGGGEDSLLLLCCATLGMSRTSRVLHLSGYAKVLLIWPIQTRSTWSPAAPSQVGVARQEPEVLVAHGKNVRAEGPVGGDSAQRAP